MECIIIVYRENSNFTRIPIAEIRWTGKLPKNLDRFVVEHGGDYAEVMTIEEHIDWCESYYSLYEGQYYE
jgi:hypothetical protein